MHQQVEQPQEVKPPENESKGAVVKTSAPAVIHRFSDRAEMLIEMLRYRRPAGSESEADFIKEYLLKWKPFIDEKGNMIVKVEGKGDNILWSCHTDSVHDSIGLQELFVTTKGVVMLPKAVRDAKWGEKGISSCLGADDCTGVWIMENMLRAGKPGLYVFHRAEEKGCIGSSYIASDRPEILEGIVAAVAFDRRGYDSVITRQAGCMSASDEFAQSMADELKRCNPALSTLKPDPHGVYTDTRRYTELVGECTNLSVGYRAQHTRSEEQDLFFAENLLDGILGMDVDALTFKRKPGEDKQEKYEYTRYSYSPPYKGGYNGGYYGNAWNTKDRLGQGSFPFEEKENIGNEVAPDGKVEKALEEYDNEIAQMRDMVKEDPQGAAELMWEFGIRVQDLLLELDVPVFPEEYLC